MKRILFFVLALVTLLNLCACNSGPKNALKLWETASSDIVDFSIDDAKFTVYASGTHDTTYLQPTEKKTAYGAPTGKTIVVISFTVKNNNRAGTLSIGNAFSSRKSNPITLNWKIKYDGKEYSLTGLKDGNFCMTPGVIINRDTQGATEEITTLNHLLNAGACESFRVAGIVDFEPKSLDDSFQIIINIPDSKGKYTNYTYITEYSDEQKKIFFDKGIESLDNREYRLAAEYFKKAGDFGEANSKYTEAQTMYYIAYPYVDGAKEFLMKTKENYKVADANDLKDILVGECHYSNFYDKTIFNADGTISNGKSVSATWQIVGSKLEIKGNYNGADDDICEVRKYKDGVYLLYVDGRDTCRSIILNN